MAALALKQELDRFLAKKYEEKILDTQFEQLQRIQEADNPGFVTDMLQLFIDEIEKQILENIDPRKLEELKKIPRVSDLESQTIQKVESYIHRLKGSSVSVGSYQITLACNEFRQASEQNDMAGRQKALTKIVHEFYRVKDVFKKIIELEEKICKLSSAPRQDETSMYFTSSFGNN
ncbi:hypothetical protein C5167_040417 [Papaver somniferum]|uniref:Histidine-containing phosphotransfer protein n=1 Tax=Papaver somniferum TaxID=3469 RepID=A0A4Y7IIC1_PAPSO|nr:histidine-containing phosphotransfer protein 2-like [Papaver somniferum]RZC47451.1 hypothetical protein C5167_040417 [Papaver somniferum]